MNKIICWIFGHKKKLQNIFEIDFANPSYDPCLRCGEILKSEWTFYGGYRSKDANSN